VIARDEIESIKCRTQLFQGTQTVLQSLHVDAGSVMAPVSQEHTGFAALLSGSGDEPINKSFTILVMQGTVGFQSKVDVSEYRCLAEQVGHLTSILFF
jgi:hypothetical protein